MDRADLTCWAKLAYAALSYHADEYGESYPNTKTVAKLGSMSHSSARRGLDQLVAEGLAERSPRYREDGGQTSHQWRLVPARKPVDN